MNLQQLFALQDEILLDRLENLLPRLMDETNTDMWIVIGNEYNEGPTVTSFLPSSFFHARRTSAFLFYREGDTFRKVIASKPDFSIDQFYTPVLLKPKGFDWEAFYSNFAQEYDLEKIRNMPEEDLWSCIARIIAEVNPKTISLDISEHTAFADGLSKTNYDRFLSAIDPKFYQRIISSEPIAIRWLETRTYTELKLIKYLTDETRTIIKECYNKKTIKAGKTTIGEARFYLMEQATNKGMPPWFDATVWIRRKGSSHIEDDTQIIEAGDLLHCDFGVLYGGLCSDVQEMAYVTGHEDDENVIAELNRIHALAAKTQDILAAAFGEYKSGNDILKEALETAKASGISHPMIYSHPIGIYGPGPGPTIGSFGNQNFVPGSGERLVHDSTCYAMELNVMEPVSVWDNMIIMYGQEIDILFKDGTVHFYSGRQEALHII
jgi:Xaa-Pro aminopeptidase